FIRHPGYLAGFVIILASGVALGSWIAAAVLIIPSIPGLLYRAITEDRVLQAELPGYRDYAARVRWRVLPGIWGSRVEPGRRRFVRSVTGQARPGIGIRPIRIRHIREPYPYIARLVGVR